ncbi:hypothetical protein [Paenibacillus arenosi]|uniref:Dipeptidylpeptidase IV N-terminal domain-containing protein n=1 Tax=Paenibacillus arenosi TaxID=2774142 RepID=A0ABR9B734_9BACL|nr:hypothetical protein [Paenibacillus arenosi]MBD8501217.1 hypothetical protein [Paenibacillus arenosi]
MEPTTRKDAPFISVQQIERLDRTYCSDWLSNNKLTCFERGKASADEYWHERDLVTNEKKSLGIPPYLTVQVSPIRQHAVAYPYYGGEIRLINLEQGRSITLPQQSRGNRGTWTDNGLYVTTTVRENGNHIAIIDAATGSVTDIPLPQQVQQVQKVQAKGEWIYVLDQSSQLLTFKTSAPTEIFQTLANVADFSLSPSGQELAYVINDSNTSQQKLYITSPDLVARNESPPIARMKVIGQLSWSPTGDRLAFMSLDLNQGVSGMYLISANTGSTTQLTNQANMKAPVVWSPNGQQLLVSESNEYDYYNRDSITTIYRLK